MALRNAGVDDPWIEDGIQDVRIALWRRSGSGIHDTLIIRYACIDAARRYGKRSRWGVVRDAVSLDYLLEDSPNKDQNAAFLGAQARRLRVRDPIRPCEQRVDVEREMEDLSPRWREALDNSINRRHQSNGMEQAATKAKRRLRKLCA